MEKPAILETSLGPRIVLKRLFNNYGQFVRLSTVLPYVRPIRIALVVKLGILEFYVFELFKIIPLAVWFLLRSEATTDTGVEGEVEHSLN